MNDRKKEERKRDSERWKRRREREKQRDEEMKFWRDSKVESGCGYDSEPGRDPAKTGTKINQEKRKKK